MLKAVASQNTNTLASRPIAPQKYIIQFGQVPTTTYVKANIAVMEARSAFDGVTIGADYTDPFYGSLHFADRLFMAYPVDYALLATALGEVQTTKFDRFTHNFLRVNGSEPGTVDWFDLRGLTSVIHNWGLAARFARAAGMKGLLLDLETYTTDIYDYRESMHAATKTFAEVAAQVRLVAKMLMQELQAEFPNLDILLTLGYEQADQSEGADLSVKRYGMYAAFLDGLYDAAAGTTTITNLMELAFGWKLDVDWDYGLDKQLNPPNCDSRNYKRHHLKGFCTWVDYDGDPAFDFVTNTNNYHSAATFEANLGDMLERCDKYVWVYNQAPKWWNISGDEMPPVYRTALDNARVTAGLQPAFAPTVLPGLVGWYRPSTLSALAADDPVSSWTDSSGNGNTATQTGTNRPTYKPDGFGSGIPGVLFTAANSQSLVADGLAEHFAGIADLPYTAVFVLDQTTDPPATVTYFLGLGSSVGANPEKSIGITAGGRWTSRKINDAGSSVTSNSTTFSSSPVATSPRIFVVRHSGTLIEMRLDGTANLAVAASSRTSTCTFNKARIGSSAVATPAGFNDGLLGDIVLLNVFSETADIQRLERYLGAIYGITVTP